MSFHHSMDNRYVSSGNLVYRDITDIVPMLRGVGEEEQVSTVERGFHRSANEVRRGFSRLGTCAVKLIDTKNIPQDHDDWRFGVCHKSKAFPDHKTGSHDGCKVEYL